MPTVNSSILEGENSPSPPGKWEHLFLREWPFRYTPNAQFSQVWAGRASLKSDVDRLIWNWSRQDRSSIHLLWAELGSGKTHTLMHIKNRCSSDKSLRIHAIYSVMPKQLKSFLEVYQAIMAGFEVELLSQMYLAVVRKLGDSRRAAREIFPEIPDVGVALVAVQSDGANQRMLVTSWLRGGRGLTPRQLNSLGVTRNIKTTDEAVAVLTGVVRLVSSGPTYQRLLIMLDEYQRVGLFKRAVGLDINTGLQTLYDASNNMSLLLSFGFNSEGFVRNLLSPELLSRQDPQRLSMPLLSPEDARVFLADLLRAFRSNPPPNPWYPFDQESVSTTISVLSAKGKITPRKLMKTFDALLQRADYDILTKQNFAITNEELDRVLKDILNLDTGSSEDE